MADEWRYETVPDLDRSLAERLRNFPREPEMFVYGLRSLAALAMRGWLRLYHRLEVEGRENLPRSGSFVMIANHASHLDAVCLLSVLPLSKLHRAFPVAAADYFFKSLPKTLLSAIVINALPFNRKCRTHHDLDVCRQVLSNAGNVLIVFPEGTRSTTGEMGPFKAGMGLLLAGMKVPVVPCYIEGAFRAWPKGRWLPAPRKVKLLIGKPCDSEVAEQTKESAVRFCDELRQAVVRLSEHGEGQEGAG